MPDKRKTGEGAVKGWQTRRRNVGDRQAALERLLVVAEEMTGVLVCWEPPTKECVLNWRDRINSALRLINGAAWLADSQRTARRTVQALADAGWLDPDDAAGILATMPEPRP